MTGNNSQGILLEDALAEFEKTSKNKKLTVAKSLLKKITIPEDQQEFIRTVCDTTDLRLRSRISFLPDRLSFFKLVPEITQVTRAMIPDAIRKHRKTLDIPAKVESIGKNAFLGCYELKSISLPDNDKLKTIDESAFESCTALKSITFPKGLETIGKNAFLGCEQLQSISLPDNDKLKTIGGGAFARCTALKSITFPKGLETIGKNAFLGCYELKSISLPDNDKLKTIDESAFKYCTALKSITLPKGLETIDESAFKYCTALQSITLPEGLETIGYAAFENCIALQSISLPDKLEKIRAETFRNCTALQTITFPKGLKIIDISAFRNCTALESITFPKGLEKIDVCAFVGCSALESITFPDGFEEIGVGAFADCSALKKIVVPLSFMGKDADYWAVRGINPSIVRCSDALYNCIKVENSTMKQLGDKIATLSSPLLLADALVYMKALTDKMSENRNISGTEAIEFANALLEKLGGADEKQQFINAVSDMNSLSAGGRASFFKLVPGITEVTNTTIPKDIRAHLQSITLPDGLDKIGFAAFKNCTALQSITLPEELETIGKYAFESCTALQSITLPKGLKTIDVEAFRNCTALQSISLPDKLEKILADTFKDCTALQTISLPNGLKTIGVGVFDNCSELQTITFPKGLKTIGRLAFRNCTALKKIVVPLSFMGKDADYWADRGINPSIVRCSDALYNCIKDENSTIELLRVNIATLSSPLLLADALVYMKALTDKMSENENENISGTEAIEFANALLEKLGDADEKQQFISAFCSINSLSAGGRASFFKLVPGITEVTDTTIPKDIRAHLQSITLPDGLDKIGGFAFSNCSQLQSIIFPKKLKEIGMGACNDCSKLRTISLPEGLKKIGDGAFHSCTALKSITLPDGLDEIGEVAFDSCIALESITLPKGLKTIGILAFRNCSALKKIVVPLSFMGKDADYWADRGINPSIVTCSDALYNCIKDENSTIELLRVNIATLSSPLLLADALVYMKALTDKMSGNENENISETEAIEFANALLEELGGADEKQQFINAVSYINSLSVDVRASFFKLVPGITEVTNTTIPKDIRAHLQSITLPKGLKTIDEEAFRNCTALNEIVVPLSFMGEDPSYWETVGKPNTTKVVCSDELYNAIEPDCDIDEIITTKKAGDGFTDETIGIYLNHAVSKGFDNQKVIELARSMVADDNTNLLREHLLFLYKNNRLDLLKGYESEFGEQNVKSLLASAAGETTKKLNEMVGGVSDHATHRYLYINPEIETEKDSCNVTVLIPFAGGFSGIVTDNTCKSTVEMQKALKNGMLAREIAGYIGEIDNFISDLKSLDGEGVALMLQLEKIKGECEGFLNEYNEQGNPLWQLKDELESGLESSDADGTNIQASFPESLNQYLRGNNNLYGAVFSVVDKNKGGTYDIDRYFRTTTRQTRPREEPTAVCSFRRSEIRDAYGDFNDTGDVSPFATAVADKMQSAPQVKRETLLVEVIRKVNEEMLQIGDDKLDDAKVAENLRVLIEEKEVDLLDQRNILEGLNTDLVCMQNNPEFMDVMRCIQKFYNKDIKAQQAKIRAFQRGDKAIIADLVTLISERSDNLQHAIGESEKELDAYISCRDAKGMIVRLPKADDLLMKSAQDQLRRQEAVKIVFKRYFPEEAKAKDWEEVFTDKYINLDDTRNILCCLVTDWDKFAELHGVYAPFYDTIEKTGEILGLKNANQLALFSQIAIARVNVMARSKDLSTINFGEILDDNKELRDKFCTDLAEVMKESRDVEDVILKFINDHYATFGMTRQLDQEESAYCAKQIKVQINTIKDSPHMDEFFFLGDKVSEPENGKAPETVQYGGLISMPFVELLREDQRNAAHKAQLASFRKLKMDGSTLDVSQSLTFTKMVDAHPKLQSALLERKISQIINSDDDNTFKSEFLKMAYFSPEKTYKIIDTVNTLTAEQKQKFLSKFTGPDLPLVKKLFLKREKEQKAANTLQRVYRGFRSRRRELAQLQQRVGNAAARTRGSSASSSGNHDREGKNTNLKRNR